MTSMNDFGINYNTSYANPALAAYNSKYSAANSKNYNPHTNQISYANHNIQAPAGAPSPTIKRALVPSQYSKQIIDSTPVLNKTIIQDTFESPATQAKTPKTKKAKLSLFSINDLHGHLDNMSNILGASRQFDKDAKNKNADTIKLSSGDNIAGGDSKKNNLMLQFLNHLGINASAVGNHELDGTASSLYKISEGKNFKFLAANAKTPENSQFYNNIEKSMIIEKNGNKYGLVGLMPFDLETVAGKKEALEGIKACDINDSAIIVQKEIDKLRARGINKIILLSHIGIDNDKKIIPMLDGVDIVQSGHSHTFTPELKNNETILKSKSGEPVILIQAGENGKYANVLDVEFDENGIITSASINTYQAELDKSPVLENIKTAALGESPQVGTLQLIDSFPENKRTIPCAWTNFLCDAMRAELNTDIAFVNAANTRKVPKAGVLTKRDITETTPLENKAMVSRMTEKEIVRVIREAAKTSLSENETGEPGIMHVSGLTYKVDSNGDLIEINFIDKNGNQTPIDINNPSEDKVYTVAHDSFVAEDREKPEYPGMLLSARKYKDTKQFDFDKDKLASDYIEKLPSKDNLVITDDFRIQIYKKDGSINTAAKKDLQNQDKITATPGTNPNAV